MALSPQWLDELRARLSLSQVIQRTTRLTKAGREWKACCPFHDEKSPSFTVNDEKGFYHCFGCGAHGDVIRWMTDQRGMEFMDAVKDLAGEAGMELPAPDPRAAEREERRQTLQDVTQAAQDWYVETLHSADGAEARRYLNSRGFPDDVIARFGFGYAPDARQALKSALSQFPESLLIEAGLRIEVEGREPYDRFRDRLMLPIRSARGKVIGFGGRILTAGKTDAPKYLNSPDTPLFDKGRTLYNLDRAGPLGRKSGRLLVVEGYMDVVALAAAGIEEAVAPLGTALTEAQVELLWRVCETPVLCFDGDAAGQRAAQRAMLRALSLLRPAHSLRIVRLPPGLDPDDLVKAQGATAMLALIEGGTSLVEALWEMERDALPLTTPEAKAGLKARLLEHTEAIQHPDIRALYRRELLARYDAFAFAPREKRSVGFSAQQPWKPRAWNEPAWRSAASSGPEVATRLRHAVEGGIGRALLAAVLTGLIRHPGQIVRHADALARLTSGEARLDALTDLLVELGDGHDNGAVPLEPAQMATILAQRTLVPPSPRDYAGLRFSFLNEEASAADIADDLAEAVALLVERPEITAALADVERRFESDPEGTWGEQQRLLKRKLALERRLMQRATARAGTADELNGPDGD